MRYLEQNGLRATDVHSVVHSSGLQKKINYIKFSSMHTEILGFNTFTKWNTMFPQTNPKQAVTQQEEDDVTTGRNRQPINGPSS
jgi:hypothetical protein